MLLRVVDGADRPKERKITDTLQDISYEKIIESTAVYTAEDIDGLSTLCLQHLVPRFSLKDIIRFDSVLEKRGINLPYLYRQHLAKGMRPQEACLVRDTVLPQSLHLLSEKVWDSNLSQHLYKQIFYPIFEEHEMLCTYGERYGRADDYLRNIISRYPGISQMFIPVPDHELIDLDDPVELEHMGDPQINSHAEMMDLLEKAALRIMYMSLDTKFYDFFSNRLNDGILKNLASSLRAITIRLNGGTSWLDVVHRLLMQSTSLERITFYCIEIQDMRYLDMVLSKCSGVTGYYHTRPGFGEKSENKFKFFQNPIHLNQRQRTPQDSRANREPTLVQHAYRSNGEGPVSLEGLTHVRSIAALVEEEEEDTDYISDEEAILSGLSDFHFSNEEGGFSGVSSFGFQVSSLVPRGLYRNILDHHFRHWDSLVELEFAPPKIDADMAACLSGLIQRLSFKSLTLTQCHVSSIVLDDILSCIALSRRGAPMDAVILVGLTNPTSQMDDVLGTDDSHDPFRKSRFFVSERLQSVGAFDGTKMLELSGKRLESKTQHLLWQFIYCDQAMQQLFIVNTMDSQLVCPLLLSLARREAPPLSHLSLEYCGFNGGDIIALTMFLATQAKTLLSLSFKGSFYFRDPNDIRDIAAAIRQCENLRSLSLENCNLGSSAMMFVEEVLTPNLKNLSVADNKIKVCDARRIIKYLAICAKPQEPTLDVLDFRSDAYMTGNLDRQKIEAKAAARRVLCDERTCLGFFKIVVPNDTT